MAVPKRKTSRSNTRSRRANWKAAPVALTTCNNKACGATTRPHTVCENCGHYAGREVISI